MNLLIKYVDINNKLLSISTYSKTMMADDCWDVNNNRQSNEIKTLLKIENNYNILY